MDIDELQIHYIRQGGVEAVEEFREILAAVPDEFECVWGGEEGEEVGEGGEGEGEGVEEVDSG